MAYTCATHENALVNPEWHDPGRGPACFRVLSCLITQFVLTLQAEGGASREWQEHCWAERH